MQSRSIAADGIHQPLMILTAGSFLPHDSGVLFPVISAKMTAGSDPPAIRFFLIFLSSFDEESRFCDAVIKGYPDSMHSFSESFEVRRFQSGDDLPDCLSRYRIISFRFFPDPGIVWSISLKICSRLMICRLHSERAESADPVNPVLHTK